MTLSLMTCLTMFAASCSNFLNELFQLIRMYFIQRATFVYAILAVCIFCTYENELGCQAGSLVKSVYLLITCLGLYAFQLFIHASMTHTPFVNLPFAVVCCSQDPVLAKPVQFSPRVCGFCCKPIAQAVQRFSVLFIRTSTTNALCRYTLPSYYVGLGRALSCCIITVVTSFFVLARVPIVFPFCCCCSCLYKYECFTMFLLCAYLYKAHFCCLYKDLDRTETKEKHCSERAHSCDAWVSCENLRWHKKMIMQESTRL